jgi:carboxyl-terminal processing protease
MPRARGLLAALLTLLACAAPSAAAQPTRTAFSERERAEDFDALWNAIDRDYAYFGTQRADWKRVRDAWRPRALKAATRAELVSALEGATAQLRDNHVVLSERTPASRRRIPSETDLWGHWRDDVAVIESVRTYGEADMAGLRPGQVVRAVGELPLQRAVRDRLDAADVPSTTARDWALQQALAGPRNGTFRIEIAEARGPRVYELARSNAPAANGAALLARRVGEARDLGYLRLKAPLDDPLLATHFDGAMGYLTDTRGLILDLREVTGPFREPAVARATLRAILGRFVAKPAPWQVRESRSGERVVDFAAPHDTPYVRPLVVLVDRWTAGEGEALAVGLQAAAGARLVGTRMAGLRGELRDVRLPRSHITLRFPAQKAFAPDGTPRESVVPDVLVDLAAPKGGPGDPILYMGLKEMEGEVGRR